MGHRKQLQQFASRARRSISDDGVQFVRCRICGDHRRVISGRHLSKHDIDRETYMAEYRLSPDQLIAKDFRRIQSSRRGYYPFGKSDWVSAIRTIYKKTGNVFAGYLQKEYRHIYLQGVWIYGNWDKALRAAEFDPRSMRQRDRWNPDKAVKGISWLRTQGLPLYARYVMKFHPDLFSAATREFGTWSKALRCAGIREIQFARKTRLGILRALRDIRESRSISEIPDTLKLQAEQYFGSLQKAIAQSKKDRRVVNGWSKPNILALLSRMHRRRDGLGYGKARRDVPALVSAAEAYFGSWGRALHDAGVDPNLYFVHHKWRKWTKRKPTAIGRSFSRGKPARYS